MKREGRLVLGAMASILALFIIALVHDLVFPTRFLSDGRVKEKATTARVVANGDLLYHDVLYESARKSDGSYDFSPYFQYVKPWISGADLAIGDYEGTISPDFPLSGYPLFNGPAETARVMKETGYDVVDLAHNHILDSQLSGAKQTVQTFRDLGLDTVGFYAKNRAEEGLLIKKVNGIKIAILAYSYGFNGMDSQLTAEEYQAHLSDLDEKKIKADLQRAEKDADVTIVMPQMGTEYALEPTEEQVALYHKMIDWGADVIFGGHPHVVEPAEIVTKNGERKVIIYSMGNFISNQTLERLGNKWTERGVLMDVTFEKRAGKTRLKTVKAHPTLVWSWPNGDYSPNGFDLYEYRVLILEDFIEGGKHRDLLDANMKQKVDEAYQETKALVNLKW